MPIPPIQWVKLRQNSIQWERASTSSITLAPVVVKPDTVSKRALTKFGIAPERKKGRAPIRLIIIQLSPVATQPSLR